MKSLDELRQLRERAQEAVRLREQTEGTRIVVGMGTCGIAAGATIGSGWGAAASALGGALLGGYAGNAIENHTSKTQGLEITVRLSNNQIIAVTQPADQQFNAGDRVRVLTTGSRTRVTH